MPHTQNTATPKIVTTILMITWSVLTIGKAFGIAETGDMYPYISLLVFAIVCTIWGFEIGALNHVAGGIEQKEKDQQERDSE